MSPASRIKVLVVDDSAVVRQTMSSVLASDPQIEVVGVAQDPIIASKKIETLKPDVLTLDIEMPRMDGITFLKRMMSSHPMPVVICSSMAEEGSDNAMKALEAGAVEIIRKPKLGTKVFLEESKIQICDAVKAAAAARRGKPVVPTIRQVEPKLTADVILAGPSSSGVIETTEKIVVLGASTGGTEAIRVFLEAMPLDAPGIVIVQHMPEHFTRAFATRLDSICRVSVKEAQDNDTVIRGRVLIAPGNRHMLLHRSGARYYVEIKDGPLVSRHRPSVDVLFRSAARYAGKNAVGVIMTGMGDDGARGMKELRDAGAHNLAQDERTSVVFGMPAEAIKRDAVHDVLPLESIAPAVLKVCSR